MKKHRFASSKVGPLLALLIILTLLTGKLVTVRAQSIDPWSAGEQIRNELFSAQKDILANNPDSATQHVQTAEQIYKSSLETAIKAAAPEIDTQIEQTFRQLLGSSLESTRLAYTRSYLWANVLHGSLEVVLTSIRNGDKNTARAWLLLRQYRTSTRYTRPDGDATLALQGFIDGKHSADETVTTVNLDFLDGYQTLMIEAMSDAEAARGRNFTTKVAEQAGLIVGYFEILQTEFAAERGQAALTQVQADADTLKTAALVNDGAQFDSALNHFRSTLRTFQAAPLPGAEQALRIQRIDNQMGLASLEYARGVRDGKIITDFEYTEALASLQTATLAYSDIEPLLVERDLKGADDLLALLKKLSTQMHNREAPEDVQVTTDAAKKTLKELAPADFVQRLSGSSDRDIVATFLNQVETSTALGDYTLAETARLHAYQLVHIRFNLPLLGTLPDLANDIEGLFWQGSNNQPGLATLIANRAPTDQINAAVTLLNSRVDDADDALTHPPTLERWPIAALIGAALFIIMRFAVRSQRVRGLSLIPLAICLCITVGTAIHMLQINNALPITPLYGFYIPVKLSEWLGLYPTLQGTLTQLAIIGLTYISTLLPQRGQAKAPARSRAT